MTDDDRNAPARISERMLADETLPYGKVYYEDSAGGSTWVKGLIDYAEKPLVGGGDVIRVAKTNSAKMDELPAEKVGRIEYRPRPRGD